jgi:hypothetical protein
MDELKIKADPPVLGQSAFLIRGLIKFFRHLHYSQPNASTLTACSPRTSRNKRATVSLQSKAQGAAGRSFRGLPCGQRSAQLLLRSADVLLQQSGSSKNGR